VALPGRERLLDAPGTLGDLFPGDAWKAPSKFERCLLRRQATFVETMEDFTVPIRQPLDRPKDMPPAGFLSPPVQTEIADHRPEPCHKARRALRTKTAQAKKTPSAQLLAVKELTLGHRARVALKPPEGLEGLRRVRLQELNPSFLGVGRAKPTKEDGGLPVIHRAFMPLGRGEFGYCAHLPLPTREANRSK
jgi:hypothetical protein